MIDSASPWGRALLIFFWGGLSANIVSLAYAFHPFSTLLAVWLVVLVNMLVVTIKNLVLK